LRSYAPHLLAKHRAILSQRNNVAFPFTVSDIVRMGVDRQHSSDLEALVETTLAEFDIVDLADRVITTLSGGEQQRAHFARVLVQLAWGLEHGGAGVLLLDEATAGLDLRHQLGMLAALERRAKRGVLVIAVLHDLNLAALFAERVIVLDRGRIDSDGYPAETITNKMLERVFEIETTVSEPPLSGAPFLLPHTMTVAKRYSSRWWPG
jgi:iron complex transport system ATP-binding protein